MENKVKGLKWKTPMDHVLIEVLLNEKVCGNRVDGNFTSRAYDNMVKACSEKLKFPLTKSHLKNRMKTLKSNFGEVKDLFNASGWGWNEETAMFENEDEVWKALIEKKPEVEKWRTTPFHHFDSLFKLFSKDTATGELSITAKEKKLKLGPMEASSNSTKEESINEEQSDSVDTSSKMKGKKRKAEKMFHSEILSIKEGLDNVAVALREGNSVVERGRPQVYSSEEVFRELSKMELKPKLRRKAYRFLNAKQARIRELFGCPEEERKSYLMEMLKEDD